MWGILSSREHTLCSTTTCTDHSHAVQSTAPGGKCLTRKARDKKEAYLLGWGVFNSMWVVIVIDDVQVLHCITRKEAAELHVEWCFPSPLGIHGEVGWLPIFHTWKDTGKGETEAGEVSLLEPVWQAQQHGSSAAARDTLFLPHQSPSLKRSPSRSRQCREIKAALPITVLPAWLNPGPSAFTLLASWEGSTLTLKGLAGISWSKDTSEKGGP